MSKHYKKFKVEARAAYTDERFSHVKCELCEATSKDIWNWSDEPYGKAEVNVSYKEGNVYPEGGFWTEYTVDMCPKCFKEKLIPWIESQGGSVREEEIDV